MPVPAGARVLDLAAGTGKLTRLLASRYGEVVAVEPDARMARLIAGVDVLAGSADRIPLDAASVDAVFCAEAFHWFAGEREVAEIARVLRPGGVLALLWNDFDSRDHVLPDGVMPEPTSAKQRHFSTGDWRLHFRDAPFQEFRESAVLVEVDVPRSELLDYFASVSPITVLEGRERKATLARVAAALDQAVYARRWTARLFWTTRT